MLASLDYCSDHFDQIAFRARNFASNPRAYMFQPRAKHVIPPIVVRHAHVDWRIRYFYKNYIFQLLTEKGRQMVLNSARMNVHSSHVVVAGFKHALAVWGSVRMKMTQGMYDEVYGKRG
jgi:hypothetical protein